MLKPEEKQKLIKKHKIHDKDTGSSEVQIILLSENIQNLLSHLKKNPKDQHSRYGLLKMIIKRKRLLKYLKRQDEKKYEIIIKKIGLKQ